MAWPRPGPVPGAGAADAVPWRWRGRRRRDARWPGGRTGRARRCDGNLATAAITAVRTSVTAVLSGAAAASVSVRQPLAGRPWRLRLRVSPRSGMSSSSTRRGLRWHRIRLQHRPSGVHSIGTFRQPSLPVQPVARRLARGVTAVQRPGRTTGGHVLFHLPQARTAPPDAAGDLHRARAGRRGRPGHHRHRRLGGREERPGQASSRALYGIGTDITVTGQAAVRQGRGQAGHRRQRQHG